MVPLSENMITTNKINVVVVLNKLILFKSF